MWGRWWLEAGRARFGSAIAGTRIDSAWLLAAGRVAVAEGVGGRHLGTLGVLGGQAVLWWPGLPRGEYHNTL